MLRNKFWLSFILLLIATFAIFGTANASDTGKTPAEPGAQPWMVGLVDSNNPNAHDGQFCGGSLIAPNWVLTAAHCLEGIQSASEVDLVIGRHTLSSNEGERITAAEIAVHKGYLDNNDGQDNDIALIRLSRPATAGTPIQLITSTSSPADDPGATARVTGWGVLSENGTNAPDVLHGVNIPLVSQTACQAVYGPDLLNDTICAGAENGGADSCYGDSGGPLVSQDSNGNPVQVGVVSWGEECGASGQYGVYARVTSYNQWVQNVMNGTADTITPAQLPITEEDEEWGDGFWDDEDGFWDDDDSFWGDEDWSDDDSGFWDDNWPDEEDGFWGDDNWSDDDGDFWDDNWSDDDGFWDDEDWSDSEDDFWGDDWFDDEDDNFWDDESWSDEDDSFWGDEDDSWDDGWFDDDSNSWEDDDEYDEGDW